MSKFHAKQYDGRSIDTEESCVFSYHLVLFSDSGEIQELWLPKEPEGFFRFSDRPEHNFLTITAKNGCWEAACKPPAFFMDVPVADSIKTVLCDAALLRISHDEKSYNLIAAKVTRQRSIYHNYYMCPELNIRIGSEPGNDIYYNGPYVSRVHAVISRHNSIWSIQSKDEVYGIYVNGERKESCTLKIGDVVYIIGLTIIIGSSFLSINSGLGEVVVSPRLLQETPIIKRGLSYYQNEEPIRDEAEFFNRAPRKRRESEQKVITVEGPPMSMSNQQIPLMLRMGSSMVMGGTAALAGNFMTLLTSVMFPFLSSKYTDAQRKEYEQLRNTKYLEYLNKKQQEIMDAAKAQHREQNAKYPPVDQVADMVESEHLWERRPTDSDFLQLRLGKGTCPLMAQLDYPIRRFALESDALEEKMYQLVEKPYKVADVPIVLPLTESYICGFQGEREHLLPMIRSLVIQLAVYHSYDEVKLVFLLPQSDLEQLDSIRYLPHVWDDLRSTRFLATNEAEAYAVGEYIKGQLSNEENSQQDLQVILKKRPYYVVFALDKKLLDGHEVFKQVLQKDKNPGVSILAAYEGLPKECQKIIDLSGVHTNICTTMGIDGGEDESFSAEDITPEQFHQTMQLLANTSLRQMEKALAMPKMVTFLEMFKVGRIEQLNSLRRWRENNPIKSLATPVGVGEDGSLFMLDLHEKRQGPHGLVAGMTGSGKSEFLVTYILSMAVNYHPDEVSFVLIDYKGGGLADTFENPKTGIRLPHLAGTITNLDGASIQRSLMSIESELVRRQKVFSDISKNFDEGSMNIYTYQKLYRAGKVSEPMPHLFIVSDEFAELKQQQPEFMDKLISAARIGRSLGVHLILATQKPSGVVNDQIRSNTKFRVCLRVQDRSDSMDMLKRPEAAELTDTGRFYLQVGYNEYFALGQSAWCGADYEPQDTVPVQRDDAIEFLDITGQVITQNKPTVKKSSSGMKQIGAIVQYLSNLASSNAVKTRQLCQPPLPAVLDWQEYMAHPEVRLPFPTSVLLGKLDDPENQAQSPFVLDFAQDKNLLIVGDSGSGKTTMLETILYSLSKSCSPDQFNFYVLDYSSRMLKIFRNLPHCGAVLQEEDESSLDEFFKLINSLIAERKRLFSILEVDNFRAAREHVQLPLVMVVIDGLVGLGATKKGESHIYKLPGYLKGSANYGIVYVITCNHMSEIPSRIRQEFGEKICLQVRDKYDYGELLGCKVEYTPPQLPGRGLVKWEGRPLEFQSPKIGAGLSESAQLSYIKCGIDEICGSYGSNTNAQQLPVYSETATYEEFSRQFKQGRIPLGYSRSTGKPVALPLKQFSALSLYLGNPAGRQQIVQNILFATKKENMELWVVKRKEGSLFDLGLDDGGISVETTARTFNLSTASLAQFRGVLVEESTARNQLIQSYCAENNIAGEPIEGYRQTYAYIRNNTAPIMLFFESFADFCASLDLFSSIVFDKIFSTAQSRNIYVVACFEPEDYKQITSSTVYFGFNSEGNILLFGGQFDKQKIYPLESTAASNMLQFNAGIMHYQGQLHPIIMPCGELPTDEKYEDEESIF